MKVAKYYFVWYQSWSVLSLCFWNNLRFGDRRERKRLSGLSWHGRLDFLKENPEDNRVSREPRGGKCSGPILFFFKCGERPLPFLCRTCYSSRAVFWKQGCCLCDLHIKWRVSWWGHSFCGHLFALVGMGGCLAVGHKIPAGLLSQHSSFASLPSQALWNLNPVFWIPVKDEITQMSSCVTSWPLEIQSTNDASRAQFLLKAF